MNNRPPDDETLRAYLLGTLTEEGADAIERAYLSHEDALDSVAAVEQELIDDYLSGHLAPGERAPFESRYLASPVHARRVALARALRRRGAPRRRPGWIVVTGAIAAVVILGILGVVRFAPGRPVVAITLPAVSLRGAGAMPSLTLGPGPVELRLERRDTDSGSSYEVRVRTVEGKEIWHGPALTGPDASAPIVATIPPATLREPGDYVVVLSSGGEEIRRYAFRAAAR